MSTCKSCDFYSHAPRGARHKRSADEVREMQFLLTRPSRGATKYLHMSFLPFFISTHTPLAGRDRQAGRSTDRTGNFYSHAPRGARHSLVDVYGLLHDFYSHAPRGARLRTSEILRIPYQFLLTRPSRGATIMPIYDRHPMAFLLTRPSRGATNCLVRLPQIHVISTHTPLAGRDMPGAYAPAAPTHFYSHAPRGARQMYAGSEGDSHSISTHTPLAGRDCARIQHNIAICISTHTPLAGRDKSFLAIVHPVEHFYSHAPRGARPAHSGRMIPTFDFYSHAPRGARRASWDC